MHRPLRFAVFCLALLSGSVSAAGVQQFLPQGRVDQPSRATVLFASAMAKLGDTAAPAPFAVDCGAVQGSGRWLDARTWVWQLERPLQAGERCEFSLRFGLVDLDGEAVGGQGRFAFFAAGPRPRSLLPRPGGMVDEEQAFVVDAGAALDPAAVEKNVWCEADGVGQRIPVRLLPEAQRREILAQVHGAFGPAPAVLRCAERLPPGAKMRLVWGRGAAADSGARAEREESFAYTVREPFRATLNCERERAGAPCSPLSPLTLELSAPAAAALVGKVRLATPEGKRSPRDPGQESGRRESTLRSAVFPGPFPENAELVLELPDGLQDDAGRTLANAASFPLALRTGALPPLAKFPGGFGIVELKEGGVLPVTLRHLEPQVAAASLRLPGSHSLAGRRLTEDGEVIAAMRALAKFERRTRKLRLVRDGRPEDYVDPHYARELSFLHGQAGVVRRDIPKPGGAAQFEVVGIPLAQPGYHIVEIESRLLGAALLSTPKPMYVRTAVLVTNMAVHLKRGRDNALVWVTALDSGKPVADAELRVSGCDGKEQWRGRTDSQGLAKIGQPLTQPACGGEGGESFVFASARRGEDYSFVRSDWNEGIEPWRFGVETWGEAGDFKIHSVFDRSLFRPGQTVSMKHVARNRDSRGFAFPAADSLPTRLTVRHAASGSEFSQPLAWDAQGSAVSQWKIPDSARRGGYEVVLSGGRRGMATGGGFRVADFRLPVFAGSIQGVPVRQVAPARVPLALGLSFLNGGAAQGVPVEVSATLRPRWPTYPHYERFRFSADFEEEALAAFGIGRNREQERLVLDKVALSLDRAGAGKLEVPLAEKPAGPSELHAEMSFADPNGEIQTIHGTVELWPAALALGLHIGDWAAGKGGGNRVEIVALDTAGKPLAGQEVAVRGKRRIDHSHRRRIVGGFYAYENHSEYVDLGELCRGRSDSRGLFFCEAKSAEPGSVYLLAESRDGQGNVARAGGSYWVTGGGDLWFAAGNQDRIDLIPEKRHYRPGETARFQVRTPFREATALVAVEAGGIVDTQVLPLSRFKPVIELPVRPEWGPNVYVSLLAVRGRVEPLKWYSFFQWGWCEPAAWLREWWSPQQPTALVDLAKPAYRLGLAEIGVASEGFRLQVEVLPEKAAYRPREEATVRLKVALPDGRPAPAGSEVAFAAVDQALLELQPNASWNLLESLLQKRAYEVETATAQSQVIGKRHFGKKALPPGGGGGRAPARELFDTLLAWYPRVKLDAGGGATLKVPMNDTLGEFRLVGVATAGASLFGTGMATVRTRQDLQMISGLPPLLREKDVFQAILTLRNGTARPMTVAVSARAGGKAFERRLVKLAAEGAAEIAWDAQAPEAAGQLAWEFEASEVGGEGGGEGGGTARDRLRIVQEVAPAVPLAVQQASLVRIDGRYEVPAAPPAGALPGRGGIEIGLSPRLSTPPPGLRHFFADYPFACLEQKASIAVGLRDEQRWQEIAASLPSYLDGDGLARYFPGEGAGSTTLTAYLLDMAALSGFSLPEEARERMLRGLLAFAEGRIRPPAWAPRDDLAVRKLQALEALSRQGSTPAPALVRVAAALDLEPARLPTAALVDWYLVARRLPELPQRPARLAAAGQELRNRLVYAGGRLAFASERSDYWWWAMVSGDSNAFRLVEAVLDDPGWQDELPRLLRGAMERQVRGHWSTTTANAWAAVTLELFGRKFEREAVGGITRASLGEAGAEFDWQAAAAGKEPLRLPWPARGGGNLAIAHQGAGKPWAAVQVLAAVPAGEARAFGYRIARQVTPVREKVAGKASRGDVWRVSLTVEAEQDMSWVALSDPIPAGARILGDGDGRDSRIAGLDEERAAHRLRPSFVERTFGFFRAYYEFVPRGRFRIDYTLRLNNAGEFALSPTRVEAMYAPEVFGELPNARVAVGN